MKRYTAIALVLLMALTVFGCGSKGDEGKADSSWTPVTITDDLGREVTITKEPVNTAVLMGSFADIWQSAGGNIGSAAHDAWEDFDLGLSEDVVDLGSSKTIDTELLFRTDPDLVIASAGTTGQVSIKDTLEKAGIPVVYFEVNSFEDYLSMLERLTDITGRKDLYETNGLDVQKKIVEICDAAKAYTDEHGSPTVLFIRAAASGVHVKGSKGTVLGVMLKDLNCVNIADGSDLLENLSIEIIIKEDPEYIFLVQQGKDDEGTQKTLQEELTGNPAWAGLTAVKEGRVYFMDRYLYHFKPNSRWADAYQGLYDILYPATD